MSTMIIEVYDALKEAGATEEKARKAAETLANTDHRFSKIEVELAVLKWMVGSVMLGMVTALLKLFGATA